MSLSPEQRQKIDVLLADAAKKARIAAGQETKTLVKKVGDKMAAAKKPFWRKLVGFFRNG